MSDEEHVSEENAVNGDNAKRKIKPTVLDSFSKIIHTSVKVRVKSGVNLLQHLSQNETDENDENELKYALGRIVRGLGSSTNNARTGFYSALVGLLSLRDDVGVSDLFEHVDKQLHKVGSNTKGEKADIASGQILVCGAIIRSKLFSKSSADDQKKVLELLLSAGKERTYLTLVSYVFILNAVDELSEKEVQKLLFPIVKPDLSKTIKEHTLDSLYLLVSLQRKQPGLIKSKFLINTLGTETLICKENLSQLSNILTTIPKVTSLSHPIFEIISTDLAASDHLIEFCNELDLHLNRPNRNKHLVIIKLLCQIFVNLTDFDAIPDLLMTNFIKQTIVYFKSFTKFQKDLEFQKNLHFFFETLLTVLKKEEVSSGVKVKVLKRLLFYPGTFIFEKITKSKIIQQITLSLTSDGVKELGEVYADVVTGNLRIDIGENTNENWLNNDRLYAAHLLVKLLNLQAVQKENDWKVEKYTFLANLGIFKKEGISNIGSELANALKDTFFNSLDIKSSKLEDVQVILSKLVRNLDSKLDQNNLENVLRNPITSENYETWQKTLGIITKIEKKRKRSHGLKSVFLTLFLHMGLQLFNDAKLATETLNELFACYEKVRKNRKNSLNETDLEQTILDETVTDTNDPLWIEVVVDLFLNLLSHNSHLLRSVINYVFPHLCPYLNSSAIHQILSVLDPKNESNPLSKDHEDSDDSDDEVSEEESEEEEEDSDVDEDMDEDEKVTDKLRMALHKALSSDQMDDDQESIDLDEMSDSEGQKLDEALAEAFKQHRPNRGKSKKQNKDAETLTHFRIRALDLIEAYLDSTPNMLLTLEIMLPLLQAIEFSIRDEHQKPLHNRLKSCLKKLTATKKFSSSEDVNDVVLKDLLQSLLEKDTKSLLIVQEMGEQISDCCIFIIKCSQNIISVEETPKKVKKHLKHGIVEIINTELTNFFTKRDCLTPYVLFKNALNLSWDGTITLASTLLNHVYSTDVKPFKKAQVLELLKIFFSNQRYLSTSTDKIKTKLAEEVESFATNTTNFFKELCENPSENKVKERFLCNLFSCLTSIKSCPIKFEIDWKTIGETVREYRTFVSFSKDAKTAFNKLCSSLGVSHIVKMKAQVTKVSNGVETEQEEAVSEKKVDKTKKKQKAKNKEKLKLKKEAKSLRLQSLSEGLTAKVDFSEANEIDEGEEDVDMENGAEVTSKDKKRKKRDSESNEVKIRKKKTKRQ